MGLSNDNIFLLVVILLLLLLHHPNVGSLDWRKIHFLHIPRLDMKDHHFLRRFWTQRRFSSSRRSSLILTTDDTGVVYYQGKPFITSAGFSSAHLLLWMGLSNDKKFFSLFFFVFFTFQIVFLIGSLLNYGWQWFINNLFSIVNGIV